MRVEINLAQPCVRNPCISKDALEVWKPPPYPYRGLAALLGMTSAFLVLLAMSVSTPLHFGMLAAHLLALGYVWLLTSCHHWAESATAKERWEKRKQKQIRAQVVDDDFAALAEKVCAERVQEAERAPTPPNFDYREGRGMRTSKSEEPNQRPREVPIPPPKKPSKVRRRETDDLEYLSWAA